MASLLDVGILNYFVPAFVFLIIYGIIVALLEKTQIFGDNHGVNQLIAVGMGLLFILSPDLVGLVRIITPWFTIMFIFVLMVVLLFLFVGVKETEISSAFSDRGLIWVIILVSIAILIFGMTQIYGEQIHNIYPSGEFNETSGEPMLQQEIGQIIFHPRILGMLLLLLIIAQAVRMIGGNK